MSTIVTRAGKGSPLTHNEVDANFNNLNNDKVEESTTITAGTGLSGGGDLSANRTISLANTAVTPGSYGSASAVGTFTVDAQGRLTAASNTNIAIANTAVSGLGTMSTQNANNVAITGGSVNGTTIGGSTAAAGTFTSLTNSGNLTFSSTGQRITGDMSNATLTSRLAFQTSTTDGATRLMVLPNGTSTTSAFNLLNSSDANNASYLTLACESTVAAFRATNAGTGTLLPMAWVTGGSERMRLDTSGQLGIGTTNPQGRLHVTGTTTNLTGGYSALNVFSSDALAADKGGRISLGGVSGNGASFDPYGFVAIAGLKENATASNFAGYFTVSTSNAGGVVTERMRIDSSGNVGIGTASPVTRLHVLDALSGGQLIVANSETNAVEKYGTFATQHYTNAEEPALGMAVQSNSTDNNILIGGALGEFNAATTVRFYTAANNTTTTGTERMRIDSSGVGIGTASPSFKFEVQQGSSSATPSLRQTPQVVLKGYGGAGTYHSGIGFSMFEHTNGYWGSGILEVDDSGSYGAAMAFYTSTGSATPTPSERMRISSGGEVYIAGTTDQGAYNLQVNGTGVWGAGAYVNGSDARLKDSIQSLDSGLDVVKAMRPVTFQYKPEYSKDQSVQPGFIAQELQTAMAGKPYLEGVVQEGTNHLNVAYQNIIPILVKAIQELEAKVAALEAK